MRSKQHKEQQGFTIIELLIATTVFSVLLVGILASFIKIGDLYYKGVSMSKTQEDARNVVQSISDDIQFYSSTPDTVDADANSILINGQPPPAGTTEPVFCIGQHRYRFQIGSQVDSSHYGLARDTVGAGTCPQIAVLPATTDDLHMLDAGMQLNALSLKCQSGRCDVKIHVVFFGGGTTGLFTSPSGFPGNLWQAPDAQCNGSIESTDLCATVDYDSTVLENT